MSKNENLIIRKATVDDIGLLVKLRVDFRTEEGKLGSTDEELDDIKARLREYYAKHIPTNAFIAVIAERSGEPVSTAFLSVAERPPRKPNTSSLVGTVYNVYTYPEHRGNGYATMVMNAMLEEAKRLGIGYVDLLATNAGKPLYEKLGFEIAPYTPMRIEFK